MSFREEINRDIVRVVMLPEKVASIKVPISDCTFCQGLEDVAWRIQNLIGTHRECTSVKYNIHENQWKTDKLLSILFRIIFQSNDSTFNFSVCAQQEENFTEQSKCF